MSEGYFFRFGASGKRVLDAVLNAHIPGRFVHSSYMLGENPKGVAVFSDYFGANERFGVLVADAEAAAKIRLFVPMMGVDEPARVMFQSAVPVSLKGVRSLALYGTGTDRFPWEEQPVKPTPWFERDGFMKVAPGDQITDDDAKFVESTTSLPDDDGQRAFEFRIGRRKVILVVPVGSYSAVLSRWYEGSDCGRSPSYRETLSEMKATTDQPVNEALTELLNRHIKVRDLGYFERVKFTVHGEGVLAAGKARPKVSA